MVDNDREFIEMFVKNSIKFSKYGEIRFYPKYYSELILTRQQQLLLIDYIKTHYKNTITSLTFYNYYIDKINIESYEFYNFSNIKELDISEYKKIENLKLLIEKIPTLEVLGIRHCDIDNIDNLFNNSFNNSSKLNKLYLEGNNLICIDGCLDNLVNLEVLDISYNSQLYITENTFNNLSMLNKLYLFGYKDDIKDLEKILSKCIIKHPSLISLAYSSHIIIDEIPNFRFFNWYDRDLFL